MALSQRKDHMRYDKKVAVYKTRRKASIETNSDATLTLDFWLLEL